MGTTNLFVELVVIGVGVLIWLVLFAFTILGFPPPDFRDGVLFASAIPLLAITYVAGIIWDRIVDQLFEGIWVDNWRSDYFPTKIDYYNARRTILTKSERLSELLEYGRSRMRICRAWVINSILIGISLDTLLVVRFSDNNNLAAMLFTATSVCMALSIGAWFAWAGMVKTEYRKVKEQSIFLQVEPTNDA